MQKLVIILTLPVILFLLSCSKGNRPYVKIKTPTHGQVFNAPEVIKISADYTDGDLLVGVTLRVTKVNPTNDTIINFVNQNPRYRAGSMYHVIDSFISDPGMQYKIVAGGGGHSTFSYDTVFVSTN